MSIIVGFFLVPIVALLLAGIGVAISVVTEIIYQMLKGRR